MKTTPHKAGQSGFTLIELMTVVAIIGILATVAMPNYRQYVLKARAVELVGKMEMIKTALAVSYAENDAYPNFEKAVSGKVPNALNSLLTDEIFNGPETIQLELSTAVPSVWRWQRGLYEKNEPYLIIGSHEWGKADDLLIALQHIVGQDKFVFYMGHSWARIKLM
ncbi:type IV pilin protein [Desulfoluna butyratoxydans]|uniref:Prokaryotic n-terminal methylation site n=1 Tax=Desulfoluna butyratoxydans TaxID=231438 RepID=A0A4U8YLH6_9BACT|nr:prepilin-type N-terminal cleavage/methylation domain-containing protein [Desulfoluna butyratoxydans]VFQ44815.1 prokaryotic n-terminal methylation site [Desulfoluna butyratoxydans]